MRNIPKMYFAMQLAYSKMLRTRGEDGRGCIMDVFLDTYQKLPPDIIANVDRDCKSLMERMNKGNTRHLHKTTKADALLILFALWKDGFYDGFCK